MRSLHTYRNKPIASPKKKRLKRALKGILILLAALILAFLAFGAYRMYAARNDVPVLNYHQINDRDENALTVHTDQFEAQMKYLADHGYHTITPAELLDSWENGTPLPDKPVIITLDDGYVDNYKNAFPILEKYNLRGTIFLVSDFIGTYPNYLTWAECEEMQESGLIDFESHTLSHAQLDKVSDEELHHQLTDSKLALQWNLKKNIDFIAYPCGDFSPAIEAATDEAGYRAAFTVHYGLASKNSHRYQLDRVPIFGCNSHTFQRFRWRLELAPIFGPIEQVKRNLRANGHDRLARLIPSP